MNKNGFKVILFFSLFLVMLFSSRGYAFETYNRSVSESIGVEALASRPNVYPPSPQTYPISNIWFNISWQAEEGSVDKAWITHNFSKNLENYTMTNKTPISNDTPINFYYKLDFTPAAGIYEYTFYANATGGGLGVTDTWTYVISKNSSVYINLTLDGDESNKTDDYSYEVYDTANFTVTLNWYDETIYLDSNYPGWILQNGTNSTIINLTDLNSTGLYYITAYWNNVTTNENYTDAVQTYFFGVAPYWINNTTSVASGSTYLSGQDYQFNITWIGNISNISFESNFSVSEGFTYTHDTTPINISNDTNDTYWITFTDLPAGNYYYKWNINDTNGNSASTENITYIINKKPTTLSLTATDWSILTSESTPMLCSSNELVDVILHVSGLNDETDFQAVSVDIPGSVLGAGDHACYCSSPGNTNYSANSTSTMWLSVTSPEGDNGDTGGSSGGDDFPPSGTFTIQNLASSLSVNAGESKPITFNLKNTLNNNILDITVSLTGIDSSWYSIPKIDDVVHGTSGSVTITFNIPEDAEAKVYSITIKAKGKKPLGGTKTTPSKTLTLTVNPKPEEVTIQEAVITPQETIGTNETEAGPTGFLPLVSEYFPYLILLLGAIVSILIFVKRSDITYNLMKFSGRKAPKKLKKKPTKTVKLPSFKDFSYKLFLGLKKGKEPKTLEKPEKIEREIKKDIKELQNILEAEKRIKKRRK